MLLILEDDGCVHVYPSVEAAVAAIEPGGAHEGLIRAAFDETGTPYRVEWLEPPDERRMFGVLSYLRKGSFAMAPAGPPDVRLAIATIESAPAVFPEDQRSIVATVLERLKGNVSG